MDKTIGKKLQKGKLGRISKNHREAKINQEYSYQELMKITNNAVNSTIPYINLKYKKFILGRTGAPWWKCEEKSKVEKQS